MIVVFLHIWWRTRTNRHGCLTVTSTVFIFLRSLAKLSMFSNVLIGAHCALHAVQTSAGTSHAWATRSFVGFGPQRNACTAITIRKTVTKYVFFFFFLKHAVSVENIYMLAQRFDYKIDEWLAKDPKYRSYTQEWNRMHAYFMCTVHTSTCFLFFFVFSVVAWHHRRRCRGCQCACCTIAIMPFDAANFCVCVCVCVAQMKYLCSALSDLRKNWHVGQRRCAASRRCTYTVHIHTNMLNK